MYANLNELNQDTEHLEKLKKVYVAERIYQGPIDEYEGSSLHLRGERDKTISTLGEKPTEGNYQAYLAGGIAQQGSYRGFLFGHAYEVAPTKEDNYERLITDGGVALREVLVSRTNAVTFKIPNVENRQILQYAFSGELDDQGDLPIASSPSGSIESKRFFVTIEGRDDEGKINRLVYSNCKIKVISLNERIENFRGLEVEIVPELDGFTALKGNVGYYLNKVEVE